MTVVDAYRPEAGAHGFSHTYRIAEGGAERVVALNGNTYSDFLPNDRPGRDPFGAWWLAYLRAKSVVPTHAESPPLSVVDLFSSVGGLSLGVLEAARALEFGAIPRLAVDVDQDAVDVYRSNMRPTWAMANSVRELLEFRVAGRGPGARFALPPRITSPELGHLEGSVDILLGGPPCQGHSSLNNRTRGDDPRNRLYLAVPAVAVATGARAVIIENVPNVVHDKNGVVETSKALLRGAGYHLTEGVLKADRLGWPQTRRRYFLVATRDAAPLPLSLIADALARDPLPVAWAIRDFARRRLREGDAMFSTPQMSTANEERIAWLFENDEFDLPDERRPDCHKDGHTYPSVYGRMKWDTPAGTITGGFMTPGRGRFIHPKQPRVLTPREAARIQGFPDWFTFQPPGMPQPNRANLAKWIGDAVPPILGYVAGLAAISALV